MNTTTRDARVGRLDEVIDSAKRMTGERLDERLPVSENGDPLDRLSIALNDVLAPASSAAWRPSNSSRPTPRTSCARRSP